MGKIVYVVETYTEGLGYIDNVLPAELAKRDHETSIITARLPAYYQSKTAFFGSLNDQVGYAPLERSSGVAIHTLSYRSFGRRIIFRGLFKTLKLLKPDVVIVRGLASPVLAQVIVCGLFLNFNVVTSTGRAYSAVPKPLVDGKWYSRERLKNLFTNYLIGRTLASFTSNCVASTDDGRDAAVEFYGIPFNKVSVIKLGVDTDNFTPVSGNLAFLDERNKIRSSLKVEANEILCVWSGRMTKDKGLLLLATAIEELVAEGYLFRVLFIGAGDEYDALKKFRSSIVLPFVNWKSLPPLYRAADISVWPSSITTSTLDASACGLPVVMSANERAIERWSGIGSSYEHLNLQSLKSTLLKLADKKLREDLGCAGVKRMRADFSWKIIAEKFEHILFRNTSNA